MTMQFESTNGGGQWLKLDAHAWCEDNDGNVVFDPYFKEYDLIQKLRKLENKNQYEIVPKLGEKMMMLIKSNIKAIKKQAKAQGCAITFEEILNFYYTEPIFGCCYMNAYAYKFKNPKVKLFVGKMGWKKKKSGKVFWEYG